MYTHTTVTHTSTLAVRHGSDPAESGLGGLLALLEGRESPLPLVEVKVRTVASWLASIPTAADPQVKGQSAEDLGYTGSNSLPLTLAAFALVTIGICILRRSRYRATR